YDDDFEINVNDPRFTALHESHHFAIDPSNPQFKKTKSMGKLLEERQRRQIELNNQESNTNFEEISNDKNSNVQIKDSSLSLLINSVKRKSALATESNQKGKRRKTKS
ncbi:13090_t:CDS:2, partial [Funneliformis mosseae]